jgi:hypothetical protein
MKMLQFSRPTLCAGRRVREPRFVERSTLPLRAACVVANAMREALASLLSAPVRVRCSEPVAPGVHALEALAKGTQGFRVRGSRSEAAVFAGRADVATLVAAVFDERDEGRSLSEIERIVAARLLNALAHSLAPIVGANAECLDLTNAEGFATYFDVFVDAPAQARIGVAAPAESEVPAGAGVSLDDLLDIECEVCIGFDVGGLSAAEVAALGPGTYLPIPSSKRLAGAVSVAGSRVCDGECGVLDGRYALAVTGPTRGRE